MKKLTSYVILAVPFGVLWIILTNQVSLESFLIGAVLSIPIVRLGERSEGITLTFDVTKLPQHVFAFFVYSVFMLWQVFVSGLDVTLRILRLRPIRPGIIALEIGDETHNEYIAGASAHSITITPGEMVVNYDPDCCVMYVHCIDIEKSQRTMQSAQAHRVSFFRRILGV